MTATQELRAPSRLRLLQTATLALLLAFVVWRSFSLKLTVRDLDNWWHLKVGDWILHNHAFPHTGIFSATAATKPWSAYSWGYEVLLSLAYRWGDLIGMSVFGTVLTVLVAASVYRMSRHLSGRSWTALLIATIACSVFLFTMCPRPGYFSMMLFAAELTLIFEANRSGRVQALYLLPLIFLFWANLHIQFIYGLAVIGLLLAVNLGQGIASSAGWHPEWLAPVSLPLKPVAAVFAVCAFAPCISPYSFHLYQIVYGLITTRLPYQMVQEMQPFTPRVPSHYLQLLLTGAAYFAVARTRKIDLFTLSLLLLATVVGFRMMRDSWFICIVAAACIADSPSSTFTREAAESWREVLGVAAFLILAGFLFVPDTHFNRAGLDAKISGIFPVDAVNYLRRHTQPGPLYNSFDWGGFLIWYMPDFPVAIDGRTDLYGDELIGRFFATGGGDGYLTDPYLNRAGIVLLERELPLAALLERDPRFQKVYEDRLAVVFVRGGS